MVFWGAKRYRLLRNRVSAQQARERKKAYLSDLEVRVKDLEQKNSELDERLSTLQNENQMLRHVLSLPYFIFIIIINSSSSIHHHHHHCGINTCCRSSFCFILKIKIDAISQVSDANF